jgi:hypothetical protein
MGAATVTGQYKRAGKVVENVTAITAVSCTGAGQATLRTKTTAAKYDATLQFCVTALAKAGYAYNARLNKVTCATVVAKPAGRRAQMGRSAATTFPMPWSWPSKTSKQQFV